MKHSSVSGSLAGHKRYWSARRGRHNIGPAAGWLVSSRLVQVRTPLTSAAMVEPDAPRNLDRRASFPDLGGWAWLEDNTSPVTHLRDAIRCEDGLAGPLVRGCSAPGEATGVRGGRKAWAPPRRERERVGIGRVFRARAGRVVGGRDECVAQGHRRVAVCASAALAAG